MPRLTCQHCSGHFDADKSKRKYCSEGCYFAARRVPIEDRFWTKVLKTETCWEWIAQRDKDGYGIIKDTRVKRTSAKAHRIAWELTFGPIPCHLKVLHTCDNPRCVNPQHLFLGTITDNNHDCIAKGRKRHVYGSANSFAKLTEKVVAEIRRDFANGMTQAEISKEYDLDFRMVHKIVKYQQWKHVCLSDVLQKEDDHAATADCNS